MKTWVKLYTHINHDPEIGWLDWAQRGLIAALWALAGEIDDRDAQDRETGALGTIKGTAWRLRCDEQQLRELMRAWGNGEKLIERDGILVLVDYAASQARAPYETREAIGERVRRHRAQQAERNSAPAAPEAAPPAATQDTATCSVTDPGPVTEPAVTPAVPQSVTVSETDREAEPEKKETVSEEGAGAPRDTHSSGSAAPLAQKQALEALRHEFARLTGISPPAPAGSLRERDAIQEKWDTPLRQIATAAGWDGDLACTLLARAVEHLRGQKLTVTCPRSVADTALALRGEVIRQRSARQREHDFLEQRSRLWRRET